VNGNLNLNLASWVKGGLVTPYSSSYGSNNSYVDLTGTGKGNGGYIEQNITFSNRGCFTINFDLGTLNEGTNAALYTAGVDVTMFVNGSLTPVVIGNFTTENVNGNNAIVIWSHISTGLIEVQPGDVVFRFSGNNGYSITGNDFAIDNISLASTPCACNCPPLPNVLYSLGSGFTRGTSVDCSTNKIINIKCQQQVNIFANANCQGDGCTQSGVNISVAGPGVNYSTAEDENVLAFFAMQKGDYVVTTTSTCNGKTCTPCKVTFRVTECSCPPPPCCKTAVQVTLKAQDIKFQYAAETRVTVPFQLNGGGKKFTQVRANIVEFDIYSDNQKCIDCFNDSKLWGSIYNGTLSGFNPTYTGKNIGNNVNTREVVFANPVAQSIKTTNLELKLFLPPAQTFTCCNVYADMYIKITYRDNECNECDTIIPVRVSLVKTKNDKPVEINLPGNPPLGILKAKAWMVDCCPEPHPWKSWR